MRHIMEGRGDVLARLEKRIGQPLTAKLPDSTKYGSLYDEDRIFNPILGPVTVAAVKDAERFGAIVWQDGAWRVAIGNPLVSPHDGKPRTVASARFQNWVLDRKNRERAAVTAAKAIGLMGGEVVDVDEEDAVRLDTSPF